MHQADRAQAWAALVGVLPQGGGGEALSRQIMGSIGQLTSFVGSALGAISSAAMILVPILSAVMNPVVAVPLLTIVDGLVALFLAGVAAQCYRIATRPSSPTRG